MFRKAVFTLLALSLFFSSPISAKEKKDEQTSSGGAIFVMALPQEFEITTKSINVTKDEGSIDITYPEISGLEDKEFEEYINHLSKMKSENSYRSMTHRMQSIDTDTSYQLIKNFKIKDSLPHLLVIGQFEYYYIGGKRGSTKQEYLTIDLNTQQILTLDSLFTNNDYKDIIKNTISNQIQGRTQNFTITGDEVFYINEMGDLIIVFNLSDIQAYGTGTLEFKIPNQEIKKYLRNF